MKQFSYTCTDEKEFTRSLVAFRQKQMTFTENISAILATLYIITSEKTKIPTYSALIKRYFPMASIIGGTTFTSINNTSIENPAITVTFTIFTEANIKIIPLPVTNSKPIFTGQSFLNHINKVDNLKAVQLIASGHDLNMETLLGEVSKCDPEIVFFGPSLTAAIVVCVGLLGAIFGFKILEVWHVKNPYSQGLGMGAASHAVGTSRAMEKGETYGAYSSLGLILNGVLTALLTPIVLKLLGF